MVIDKILEGAFTSANRLHLHQTGGDFGIQFTNNSLGTSASNGFGMDLLDDGRFQFSQYQDQDVLFKMPNSLLMQLIWDNGPNNGGQVKIGPTSNPPLNIGNLMYNPALVNLGGALAFSHPASGNANNTLIYYNTSINGNPTSPSRDGFRIKYHFASEGVMQGDCLVFEKTDGQSAEPDGCIKFTNYGNDAGVVYQFKNMNSKTCMLHNAMCRFSFIIKED